MKTKNEPNYVCTVCGVSIFNATKEFKECTECGGELKTLVKPNIKKETNK